MAAPFCRTIQVLVVVSLAGRLGLTWASAVGTGNCPKNFIIGAEGCATHSMFHHLLAALDMNEDASVYTPHTFDRLNAPTLINSSPPVMEFAPSYLHNPQAAQRVKTYCNYTADAPPRFVAIVCDPATHAWHQYKAAVQADEEGGRRPLEGHWTEDALVAEYRKCIDDTLPPLQKCMAKKSYKDCGDLLHGVAAPGTGMDAMGTSKPCSGVIFKSLFDGALEFWFKTFPKSNHYVFHMEDVIEFPDILVASIAGFFNIPHRTNGVIDPNVVEHKHNMFSSAEPPNDTQAKLTKFLGKKWEKHVTRIPYSLRMAAQAKAKMEAGAAERQAALEAKANAEM